MSENYSDNPLFISYAINYSLNDELYGDIDYMDSGQYIDLINKWDILYSQFPETFNISDVVNEINQHGFHIKEIRDTSMNMRGILFPNNNERLAFSLKYGL